MPAILPLPDVTPSNWREVLAPASLPGLGRRHVLRYLLDAAPQAAREVLRHELAAVDGSLVRLARAIGGSMHTSYRLVHDSGLGPYAQELRRSVVSARPHHRVDITDNELAKRLRDVGGNQQALARSLGISPGATYTLVYEYGLRPLAAELRAHGSKGLQ